MASLTLPTVVVTDVVVLDNVGVVIGISSNYKYINLYLKQVRYIKTF